MTGDSSFGGILAIAGATTMLSSIISFAVSIFTLVCDYRIFTKMGIEGWKAIIPIYNLWLFSQRIWGAGWKFLLMLIPIVGIYFAIKWEIDLAKCFGKDVAFAIGLLFLPPIFLAILAFDDSTYLGARQ